jgi:acyl-CoA synthetase (AMP-forming)/AMP-acid ligase II
VTVIDQFLAIADSEPDRKLYVYVDDEGKDLATLTYGALLESVRSLVSHYRNHLGLKSGDRVILVYPPSLDFAIAFVSCLAAGVIPVPVAPPNPFRPGRDRAAFEAITRSSEPAAILTNRSYDRKRKLAIAAGAAASELRPRSAVPWHRTDSVPSSDGQAVLSPSHAEEPAFLQYTSGSTAAPKGVMISHANINHQVASNAAELGLDASSRSVAWLPHFHDFCLVSAILSMLSGNGLLYLMSPLTFLRRPQRWFEVMSRVEATHTAAPDFAYRLAVRRTTSLQRAEWDLSSLEVVMSAGEPVRPSTVEEFLSAFAPAGLDPSAFGPAYGLAEHTVGVSTSGVGRITVDRTALEMNSEVRPVEDDSPTSNLTLLGCGRPSAGVDVRIVDPETCEELSPSLVGEIWVDSPSKALGYFGQSDISQATFEAQITDTMGGTQYLRTGDLGFLHAGELYITGRIKDTVIVRGRNLYPQDLEETISASHPLVRPGRIVVFAEPRDTGEGERVVALCETRTKRVGAARLDEIVHAVRASVVRDHHINPDKVVVTTPGTILKTTSGKLRRGEVRRAFLEGALRTRTLRLDELEDTSAGS